MLAYLKFEKIQPFLFPLTLYICLAFAVWLRVQNVTAFEGKYLLGTDSYHFFRQADYIDKHGSLPSKDMMRWLPEGRDLSISVNLSSYVMAYLTKLIRIFIPSATTYQVAVYYSIICYLLALLVLYMFVKRCLDRYTALLSVLLLVVLPSVVHRTMAGFADRDALILLLAILSLYFYVRSIQAGSLRNKWW